MEKQHVPMKRLGIFLLILTICIPMFLWLPGTLATFLAHTEAENYINFGGVDLKIIQTTLNAEGIEQSYNSKQAEDVTTRAIQSRIIRVKNTGSHALYVRVQPQLNGKDSQGKPFDIGMFVEYETNTTDWVYKDGWYCYMHILEPNEVSEVLLEELIFDVNRITEKYPGSTFDIDFYAQGVQSEHQETTNVLEVVGWPNE